MIGAITSGGRFFQNNKLGSICSDDVTRFLEHLVKHVAPQVVNVAGNARILRAKIVQKFVASHELLSLVYLPPYAPELNPIELVWAHISGIGLSVGS